MTRPDRWESLGTPQCASAGSLDDMEMQVAESVLGIIGPTVPFSDREYGRIHFDVAGETVWVPVWAVVTNPSLRWVGNVGMRPSGVCVGDDRNIYRVPIWEWRARMQVAA